MQKFFQLLESVTDLRWIAFVRFSVGLVELIQNSFTSVTFSYVGKDSDFETFLKTIVRDYLAVDDPAAAPETDFVQRVESNAA